jgi:hypothetical protein
MNFTNSAVSNIVNRSARTAEAQCVLCDEATEVLEYYETEFQASNV